MSGLVALGDSITRDGGAPVPGVRSVPWAERLAGGLGLACHNLARDGAGAAEVLREQVPLIPAEPVAGCLYVGVNDARHPEWDSEAFAQNLEGILAALAAVAALVVVVTMPEDLGEPTAAPKPRAANALIRAEAGRHGAIVVTLDDLAGSEFVLPDKVHLTALGELEIARRAAEALRARGIEVPGSVDAGDGPR